MTACGGTAATSTSGSSGGVAVLGDCGNAENGFGTGVVDYVKVYQSSLTEWCVDRNLWNSNSQDISKFFGYGDAVLTQLQSFFPVTPPSQPFIIEVKSPYGGASTGCDFNGGAYCNSVTGDAYYNVYNDPVTNTPVPGFWGYLLTLHEAINVYTGLISGGWPSDWWADDRSPFPNAMDYEILQTLGTQQNNATLLAAATAQKDRFDNSAQNPSGYDPEVAMFVNFYNQFCQGSPCTGFPAYRRAFGLVVADHISWPSVSADASYTGDNNYSAQLSEYVIAYLQLGFGTTTDLTQAFVDSGVGSEDTAIPAYTVDPSAVLAIADARCSLVAATAAGVDTSTAWSNFLHGNYQNAVVTGGTQQTCPASCAWNTSSSQCVAPW
jgi:hypothetical protein